MNQSFANETQIDRFRLNCQFRLNYLDFNKRVNTEAAAHR